MREVKAYQCDYCGKKYHSKSAMIKHENNCFYNEANETCGSCIYNDFGRCFHKLKKKGELPILNCEKWELNEIE